MPNPTMYINLEMLHINQYIHIVLKYSSYSLKATKCPSFGALGILVGTILPKSIAVYLLYT